MRFPRMTTRRMMVAVAIVALLVSGFVRRKRFQQLARLHSFYAGTPRDFGYSTQFKMYWLDKSDGRVIIEQVAPAEHRRRIHLKEKYERAAWMPWLPVAPDPPEPE